MGVLVCYSCLHHLALCVPKMFLIQSDTWIAKPIRILDAKYLRI